MSATATPLPRLNQRLEVAVGERGSAQYFSRLLEETADTLRISVPEMQGTQLELDEGDALRLWYTQSNGYWCLHSVVRTVYVADGETVIEVDRQGEVHRAQRRNHVRVDVSLLVHAQVEQRAPSTNDEDVDEARLHGTLISGVSRNISGGGISFRSPVQLVPRDRLSLSFYLPEQDGKIASKAAVVHSHPDPEREGQWIVACNFERMAITDRERIIRFLFFRQRELAGRPKVRAGR